MENVDFLIKEKLLYSDTKFVDSINGGLIKKFARKPNYLIIMRPRFVEYICCVINVNLLLLRQISTRTKIINYALHKTFSRTFVGVKRGESRC